MTDEGTGTEGRGDRRCDSGGKRRENKRRREREGEREKARARAWKREQEVEIEKRIHWGRKRRKGKERSVNIGGASQPDVCAVRAKETIEVQG